MSRFSSKYNNLQNYFVVILPTFLYLFYIKKIVYPLNYQQDDVRELYISEYLDFACIVNKGDNHPLWTYLIWFFSKFSNIELGYLVSSLNIFFLITSLYFIVQFFIEKFNKNIAILISIIFVSSPTVLTYSVSLKQYMIELLFSSYCLYVSRNSESLQKSFNSISFYIISILMILGSLVNAGVFFILMFYFLIKDKFDFVKLKYLLVIVLPATFYIERIVDKVTRDAYGSYWENFFIVSSKSGNLIENFIFIFNMLFKSYLGIFYRDQLVYLLIPILFGIIFYKVKLNLFPKLVFLSFLVLNILKLYPLGTGRTDIVLFPFVLVFIASILSKVIEKFNSLFFYLLTFVIIIFAIINVNPFYKQEQVDSALIQIQESMDREVSIVIAKEQFPSFEYYGRTVFGSKTLSVNNCKILKPDIEYFVIGSKDIVNQQVIEKYSSIYNNSEIIILGIALESYGIYKDIEEAIILKGYTLLSSSQYPDGIYLNTYRLDS